MSNFRGKLAAILLDSPLNSRKGCPEDEPRKQEVDDPTDCVIVEKMPEKSRRENDLTPSNIQLARPIFEGIANAIFQSIMSITDEDQLA